MGVIDILIAIPTEEKNANKILDEVEKILEKHLKVDVKIHSVQYRAEVGKKSTTK